MKDDEESRLTDEQRRVVGLPADAMALVTAGPGTGKTHTLVQRVAHLLDVDELAGYEILVLTFSRAAVATLKSRLRALGGDAARVRARTFDSWALELLREVGREDAEFDGDFGRRIREATELLADETVELLPDLRHVVVDEVQDLVGARRQLVSTLLAEFKCGFTLVGDLAQSIYGFQVDRSHDDGTFVEDLRHSFPALEELALTRDFRFRSEDSRRALVHGAALRGEEDRLRALRDTFESLDPLGAVDDDLAVGMFKDPGESTAILCRTNGEALIVSDRLRRADVRHRLRRSATDRAAPGWLATLVQRTHGSAVTRDRFESFAAESALSEPEALWSLLLRVASDGGRRVVDLARLRDAIAGGGLPDELVAEPDAEVVVSSLHRAKGLEFDRVVVVDPGDFHWQTVEAHEAAEEARLLFVAMTRARDQLWSAEPVRSWQVRLAEHLGRCGRYGRQPWQRLGLEITAGDVVASVPGWHDNPAIVDQSQDEAAARLRSGDLVEMVRADTVVPDGDAPDYLVVHDGATVGAASPRFRSALQRFQQRGARSRATPFPSRIHELWVDGVETVVEGVAASREAGLNDFGVRRVPRLVGLSRFEYAKGDFDA